MCDCTNCACKAPIDRLFDAARVAMAKHYPDYEAALKRGDYSRIVDIFAGDALAEKGLNSMPHRMSDEKLEAMLAEHLATLFDGLSESMIAFYADKLKTARP